MGLYDDRMEDLSESRRRRPTARRPRAYPGERPYPRGPSSIASGAKAARKSMEVQSLLFSRDSWTEAKAKKWAKEHGYKYGKVDVTEQYIRIRQFDPKGLKVKRTITLGRGIRAVVAREENMAGTAQAARRRKKASAPRKRSTRRKTKAAARRKRSSTVMARRKKPARRKKTTRRRRRARASESWRGDRAGHRKAAKKGWRRRKRARASETAQAPRRRRRRRRTSEPVAAAPRRRRRRRASAPRRRSRRRTYARAPRRGNGMSMGEFAVAVVSAGMGFVIADGLDRFLATYNPADTKEPPKDKFTSDGAGTLANTLNVASAPGLARLGAGVGLTAVPAVASMYVGRGFLKTGLQGLALGSGIKLFSTLWSNVLMPMLVGKDTSAPALQKSYVARLYPAEVAAKINRDNAGDTKEAQIPVSSGGGSGALSAPPDVGPFALSAESPYPDAAQALRREAGMGATPGNDYPTVQNTWGTGGDGDFPTATQAMEEETGVIGDALGALFPQLPAAQLRKMAQAGAQAAVKSAAKKGMTLRCVPTGVQGVGAPAGHGNPGQPGVSQEPPPPWQPGPPPLPGPGPQAAPGEDPACGCMADGDQFLGFIGDEPTEEPLYAGAAE